MKEGKEFSYRCDRIGVSMASMVGDNPTHHKVELLHLHSMSSSLYVEVEVPH